MHYDNFDCVAFLTPSTPSVIQDTVNLASNINLRGTHSSIHNPSNQMSIPENLDLANIFLPGIPPLPQDSSLLLAMSHTPDFRGNEEMVDGINLSSSPEKPREHFSMTITSAIASAVQPMWATIHWIEATVQGGQPYLPKSLPQASEQIKPLFANVATQAAVAQQQQVSSVDQAHAVQGCKPAGNQGPCKALSDADLTEITVIHFGGLEDEEEEHKFREHNPVEIVQAVKRDLAKHMKNPPVVLSRKLMVLKLHLCSLFKGHTELVPTKGWTWIQLRLVPTADINNLCGAQKICLSHYSPTHASRRPSYCVPPHWQCNPLTNDKILSTVLMAIIDEDNSICQGVLTHGVCMFEAQVKFLRYSNNPSLTQCPRSIGPLLEFSTLQTPQGGQPSSAIGAAEHTMDAITTTIQHHLAQGSRPVCLKRGDFQLPCLLDLQGGLQGGVVYANDNGFTPVKWKNTQKPRGRQRDYSPPLSAFIVLEVKSIPLDQCPNEPDKNILLCLCCLLPSIGEYKKRFVSVDLDLVGPSKALTAHIISSKGKLVMGLYQELHIRKGYGTALLTQDYAMTEICESLDIHEDKEIEHLLSDSKFKVGGEINNVDLEQDRVAWAEQEEDGTLPDPHFLVKGIPVNLTGGPHAPISVEAAVLNKTINRVKEKASDMGWGPSVTLSFDA
ncbi:hypothetical protein V8E53_002604 [Lactarius tabidus]